MFGTVKEARCALEDAAFELDAARLLLPDVEGMLDELGKIKRLADGMIGQVARRVGDAKAVARALHVSTGEVRGAMETAELVEELPALDAAVRRGELSAREAQLIAGAAIVNPEAESPLLETAKLGLVPLKDACVNVRAAVEDPGRRRKRQQCGRRGQLWTNDDGMLACAAQWTAEVGARIKVKAEKKLQEIFRDHKAGEHEPLDRYMADALAALILGDDNGRVDAYVHVVIDHGALMRGGPVAGEVCEIPGVGPVDVSWVKELMGSAFLTAVIKKGKDIATVAHLGRHVPAEVMTALIVNGHDAGSRVATTVGIPNATTCRNTRKAARPHFGTCCGSVTCTID